VVEGLFPRSLFSVFPLLAPQFTLLSSGKKIVFGVYRRTLHVDLSTQRLLLRINSLCVLLLDMCRFVVCVEWCNGSRALRYVILWSLLCLIISFARALVSGVRLPHVSFSPSWVLVFSFHPVPLHPPVEHLLILSYLCPLVQCRGSTHHRLG